jgi:hypothetical protein
MKTITKSFFVTALALVVMSCSKEGKKRGVDYAKFKSEVTMTPEQEKSYDEITAKYQNLSTQNFEAAKAQGGQMDRVALGIKGEELRAKQSEEMATVLDAPQMDKFNQFVEANSRKRPRYNNDLLEKIKTELALSEDQFAMLNAANDAFEKSFNDAHDIYHGNNDLAKEYWTKLDTQRKEAVKGVFSPEQNQKFLDLVKDQKLKERE